MKVTKTFFCICLILTSTFVWAQQIDKIAKVEVTGNESIDRGAILNSVKTKENDPYNLDKLREDMKNIYKTGFFSDVQIDIKDSDKGKVVTFVVIERPPIKMIYVVGNKQIKTDDIREKLKVKTNTVMNIEKIKESMDEVKKLYAGKGYYNAKVTYEIIPEEGYDIGVKFLIDEPEKAFVKKISFTGNKNYSADKLKGNMGVREKGMFSWFTGSGILEEEALDDDRKRIESFYSDNGYVRVKVGVPDISISKDGKSISIVMPIEEGSVYKIGKIDFAGDLIFPTEVLQKDLQSKPGNTFRSSFYREDIIMLTDLYQDKGHAFTDISPLTLIDDNAQKIDLTFHIMKGKEIFVNRINILGNIRTRDKVIRRELRLAEGDRYSATGLKRSKERLTNTQYFKEVDLKLIKTEDPDKINLDVTVEEKPTGTFNISLGYSTSEKAIISGSVSQQNLFGTGKKLFLNASIGSITNDFNISFVDPYIFDLDLSAGLSVFNYTRDMNSYDYSQTGASLTLTRPMTEFTKLSTKYRYEKGKVDNIEPDAGTYIKNQAGTTTISSVTLGLNKNTIDNTMNPTKGISTNISFELAGGPFGGKSDYYKTIGYYGRYIPAGFWNSQFFVKGTAGTVRGYGGSTVPVFENFFVGGLQTVRGFKYGEAGPLDENGDAIGGSNELFFNFEWIFPIYAPAGLKGVVFFDAGHGFDKNKGFLLDGAKTSAGTGIRWFSPFGPIRLEIGFNLNPKKGERKSVFDFALGSQF
jgi:outer membrane protein insertion porin family